MSRASQIRRVRKLRRGIGKRRMTRMQFLDLVAVRTLNRFIKTVGREHFRVTQDTAFSLVLETVAEQAERILQESGYLKMHSGEFVHKSMRLSDLAGIGATISLVPVDPTLPEVSEEHVRRIERLLHSTEAVRLDDIH